MHTIKLEKFEGPLDLLLQLIESSKLDITDVTLANVTEQYLEYLDRTTDLRPEELADFLVVAAKLLFLKSRVLIPSLFADEDEAVDEGSLTKQLAIYRLYVAASKHIDERYRSSNFALYARSRPPKSDSVSFSPPPSLQIHTLQQSFVALLQSLEQFVRPKPEIISRTVSLHQRIKHLRTLLTSASSSMTFEEVMADATSRTDVIVSFLALLELVKQRHVVASQDSDTIVVSRVETSIT